MATAALQVRGKVLDARGKPVAGARLLWQHAPVALPDTAALSQADGSFVLAVPVAGHYTLKGVSDRHGETRVELDIGSGGSTVTLRLPR